MREKVFSHPLSLPLYPLNFRVYTYIRIYLSLIIVPNEKNERKRMETNIRIG